MKTLKIKKNLKLAKFSKSVYKIYSEAKILPFTPKRNGLTDEDILNLFVGLMNLVKNTASEKAESFYRNKINNFTVEINKKTKKLVELETELKRLKKNKV